MRFRINLIGGGEPNSTPALVLAALFMVGGLVLGGYGFTQYQDQSQSINNAVNITATVTDTNLRKDSSRRGGADYQAEIGFEYSFEGENYSSNFIYPLDEDKEFKQESEAEEFLGSYPRGEEIEAYVNPETPGKAFLNAERSDQPLILMLIGGIMAVLGSYRLVQRII